MVRFCRPCVSHHFQVDGGWHTASCPLSTPEQLTCSCTLRTFCVPVGVLIPDAKWAECRRCGPKPSDATLPPCHSCIWQGEFSVPYAAHDICNQREKLREQREHVMLVVRAYNSELRGAGRRGSTWLRCHGCTGTATLRSAAEAAPGRLKVKR